jgi:hypothetical protein
VSNAQFTFRRKGVAFRNDKLYVFGTFAIVVVRCWPELMAWKKTRQHPTWMPCRPALDSRDARLGLQYSISGGDPFELRAPNSRQLLLPFPDREREKASQYTQAWADWFRQIPPEIRRYVADFRCRYYHVFSLCGRSSEAFHTWRDNPALLMMCSSPWVFRRSIPSRRRIEWARQQVGQKRKKILETLGWPGTEAMARLVAKVPASSADIPTLLFLRDAVHRDAETVKILSHLRRLNAGVVLLVTHPQIRHMVAPSLIEEVSEDRLEDEAPRTGWVIKNCLEMLEVDGLPAVNRFYNINGVMNLHEELRDRLWWLSDSRCLGPFPPPPVPGSPLVQPICSAEDLYQEGEEMMHCVFSRAPLVARGEEYIYSVRGPLQRATLSVWRSGDKQWQLGEIRGRQNANPIYSTTETVIHWWHSVQGPGAPPEEV